MGMRFADISCMLLKLFQIFFNPFTEFVLLSSGLGLKKQKMKGGAFSPPFRGQ